MIPLEFVSVTAPFRYEPLPLGRAGGALSPENNSVNLLSPGPLTGFSGKRPESNSIIFFHVGKYLEGEGGGV